MYHLISTTADHRDGGGALNPLFAPIQDLIAGELSVIYVFRRFALLSVRYIDAQMLESLESWDGRLSCDFTFLDTVVCVIPSKIAKSMTDTHMELCAALRDDDYPESDRLKIIDQAWTYLTSNVRECALAEDSWARKLAQIETVSQRTPCELIRAHRLIGVVSPPKLFWRNCCASES